MNLGNIKTSQQRAGRLVLWVLPILLAGCSGGPAQISPAGSYPTLGKSFPTRNGVSSLMIVTSTFIDLNLGDPDEGPKRRHTGYTIYDDHGLRLQYVRNYIGVHDVEPTVIELDPGRYLILLETPEKAPPVFWVEVGAGKRTVVTPAEPLGSADSGLHGFLANSTPSFNGPPLDSPPNAGRGTAVTAGAPQQERRGGIP